MKNTPLSVEAFNRELDRVARGGGVSGEELTPEDGHALKLAQSLALTDMSASSTVRQSLRRRLAERAARQPIRNFGLRRFICFREGRALAGAGVAMLLAFIWIFGLLTPQNMSASPVYVTVAASPDLSGKPAVSLTVPVTHNPEILPKPVPTPMAISASSMQPGTLPVGTPARTNLPLGSQFPIVTTTVSK